MLFHNSVSFSRALVVAVFGTLFPKMINYYFFTSLLIIQGTLRDLSKGGRNLSVDHIEPVSMTLLP